MAQTDETPTTDNKGRPLPEGMSDRDLLIECVRTLRAVSDAVGDLAQMPMIQAMQSGSNPLMAMLGR